MQLNNKCTLIKFIFFIDIEDIIIKYDKLYIYLKNNFKISIFTSYIIFYNFFNIFIIFMSPIFYVKIFINISNIFIKSKYLYIQDYQ